MATVYSSSIILQSITTLGGNTSAYPSSGNGHTTVTVNYGDTVVVPLRSGSTGTGAGTSNYGNTPNGNTSTGGTFVSPSTSFSSTNQTINVTISNIQYDGNISFWCGPSNGGSSVGWRGRVAVVVNKDTSISLNSSSVSINDSATSYQNGLTGGGAGTIYYAMSVANIADGTFIDSLRTGGDSRYIARTFTTASSKSFSTSGSGAQITNHLPTSGSVSSASTTAYIYGANLQGKVSEYLGYSYSVNLTAAAPTVTATKSVITNGFGLATTTSGTTSGTVTYQWSTVTLGPNASGHYSTGYTSSSTLGVGVEWVGTTWQVQARATVDGGSNYVYSNTSSVTLPTFSITGPSSIEEDTQGNFSFTINNAISSTLYWQVTPTSEFATSNGSIGVAGQVGITPTSDNTVEGTENALFSLYINNIFNSLNLVATHAFTITDPPAQVTAPGAPTATANNASSSTVLVTVNRTTSAPGTNGTLQYAQSTSNSAPSSGWVTPNTGQTFVNFNQDRGSTRYYWARRSTTAVSPSTELAVGFRTDFDSNVSITPSTKRLGSVNSNATFAITASDGNNAESVYRLVTSNISTGWRASTSTDTSPRNIDLNYSEGDLPPKGTAATYTYQLSGKRTPAQGGPSNDESNWTDISGQSVTVQRVVESIAAADMTEGETQELTTVNSKLSGLGGDQTYYWRIFSPNSSFSTTTGSITTNSSGAVGQGSGISLAPADDSTTEGNETCTIKLYLSATNMNSDLASVASDTFIVGDPANITLSPSAMNEGATQELTTANNKISGLANSTTYYWRLYNASEFVTSTGSITSSSTGTIAAGSGISIQTVADNTTEGSETGTIKLYATEANRDANTNSIASADFTINDTSTSASGGGSGGAGTSAYGLIVKSSSGNAVLSSNQRSAGLIFAGTTGSSAIATGSTSSSLSAPEVTTNNAAEVVILLSPNLGTGYSGGSIGITRGTGSFTITNNSYSAIPANTPYYVVRC